MLPVRTVFHIYVGRKILPEHIYKNLRLRKLLKHAKAENAFYREHYAGSDISGVFVGSLSNLPATSKDILMDNFTGWISEDVKMSEVEKFVAENGNEALFMDKYRICSSSGTSKRMFYSPESPRDFLTETIIGSNAIMPTLSDALNVFFSGKKLTYIFPLSAPFSLSMCSAEFGSLLKKNRVKTFDVSVSADELVKMLNEENPIVVGSYLLTLLEISERRNLNIRPMFLFTSGDTLRPEQRKVIEDAFGCPLTSIYASTECGIIAYSSSNTYKTDRDIIIEFMDENDCEIAEGDVSDHIYVTCLWKKDAPVIRYRLDDKCLLINRKSGEFVPVGRDTPLILIKHEGKEIKINGYSILKIAEDYNSKVNDQIIVYKNGVITLNVKGNDSDAEFFVLNFTRDLRAAFNEKYGFEPVIKMVTGNFEKQRSGKFAELIYREE